MVVPEGRSLPGHLPVAVSNAAEFISRFLPLDEVVLGGGTVLAARWCHRYCADLDFFVTEHAFDRLYTVERRLEINRQLERLQATNALATHPDTGFMHDGMRFWLAATPVTVMRQSIPSISTSGDIESQTGVTLESTADILYKKLIGRLVGWGSLVPQDVYDLMVATYLDFPSFQLAYRTLSDGLRIRIVDFLRTYQTQPAQSTINELEIRQPRFQVQNMHDALLSIFTSDLTILPRVQEIERDSGDPIEPP